VRERVSYIWFEVQQILDEARVRVRNTVREIVDLLHEKYGDVFKEIAKLMRVELYLGVIDVGGVDPLVRPCLHIVATGDICKTVIEHVKSVLGNIISDARLMFECAPIRPHMTLYKYGVRET